MSSRAAGAACLVYAAVTATLFASLLPHLRTHLYSDLGDPLLNAAILAWNAAHTPLSADWWNFPSFAPLSGVTAFTEHLLVTYPVATPLIWATGNPILAYNVVLLLAFPLNGLCAWMLARQVTGSDACAFIGGLAYAFAPYQSVHLSHLQTLIAFGMPLVLFGLHRYVGTSAAPAAEAPSRRGALLAIAAGGLATALSNAYMLVFFPLLVALWVLWFARGHRFRAMLVPLATYAGSTAVVLPLLQGYSERLAAYAFARSYEEIRTFGGYVSGVVGISHRELLWRGILPHTFAESAFFPGVAVTALAVAAFWVRHRRKRGRVPFARILLAVSAALAFAAMARAWVGPFAWRIGPVSLPSFQPYVLFTVSAALLATMLLTSGWVRAGWRDRNPTTFYVLAALALWCLALGPEPEWSPSHWRALAYGPYRLFMELPGVNAIRVPARAWLVVVLCLSVLAASGTAALRQRFGTRSTVLRPAGLATIAVVILAEGWFQDTVVEVPRDTPLAGIPPEALVLDLPIDEAHWNTVPQYQAVRSGYRSINGYSGYEPAHFNRFRHALADQEVDALNPFRRLGDLYVIVRPGTDPRTVRWIAKHAGARILVAGTHLLLLRLPAITDPPRPRVPLPLPARGARPFGS